MSGATLIVASGRVPALVASLTGTALFGVAPVPGTAQTISSVTCSVVGGVPPYTYNWTWVAGDTDAYANSDTSATTRFSRYNATPAVYFSVWKCVVTDAAATSVDSPTVNVSLEGSV